MTGRFEPTRHLPPFSARLVSYEEIQEPGRAWMRFTVGPQHCDQHGRLHPGMLATFADGLFGRVVRSTIGVGAVTQRLEFDALDEIRLGEEVVGEAWLERHEEPFLHMAGRATVGDRPVLRAGGIFVRLGRDSRIVPATLSR
jgi:acyl-coenzyme A thioesterase PaaI-like protein